MIPMRFWVGVTDNKWFQYLAQLKPDEVNFWQPGGRTSFKAVEQYAPFLFKLHSPYNYIVGGGFFVRHSFLPLSLAWDSFQQKNGAPDYLTFRTEIMKYRERSGKESGGDPIIGCIILTSPFFFPKEKWIPVPRNWSPNIVQGKTYSTDEPEGARLWNEVLVRLEETPILMRDAEPEYTAPEPLGERYGSDQLIRPRLGQGAFRVLVTEAYSRRCAVTGEKTLPVLDASHIMPYAEGGPHAVNNGLLLRKDLHTLFDRGYMTITEDYRIEVSRKIKELYNNGREYYQMHGKRLVVLPSSKLELPSREYIKWHNENVYVS